MDNSYLPSQIYTHPFLPRDLQTCGNNLGYPLTEDTKVQQFDYCVSQMDSFNLPDNKNPTRKSNPLVGPDAVEFYFFISN